jgi:hypothetical protein
MWWDILKESKQTSRTMGSIDWENEAIPEEEEDTCKKKLLKIVDYLKGKQTVFKHNKSKDALPASVIWYGWENENLMACDMSTDDLDDFSDEAVCFFLNKLKENITDVFTTKHSNHTSDKFDERQTVETSITYAERTYDGFAEQLNWSKTSMHRGIRLVNDLITEVSGLLVGEPLGLIYLDFRFLGEAESNPEFTKKVNDIFNTVRGMI